MQFEGLRKAQSLATRHHENLTGQTGCLKKLRGFGPLANHPDRATAGCLKHMKFEAFTAVKIHIVPVGL
jgi:hypothetical protein